MMSLIVVGRLHPLLVHLPIGMLIVAFLMEWLSRKEKYSNLKPAVQFTLGIAALSAIMTSFTGWIMPKNGQFDESLLSLHFWFGISLTAITCLLYLLSGLDRQHPFKKYYFPFFAINMVLLGVTGHFGGSLTHGSNYLFESATDERLIVENVEDIKVFDQIIHPILKKKCVSCHNEGKLKGELLMTTKEALLKGGKTGALFVAGDVGKSLMIQRIRLPKTEKEHMPPKGKAQLNNEEQKLIEWWISKNADFNASAGELDPGEDIRTILEKYRSTKAVSPVTQLASVPNRQLNKLGSQGFILNPMDNENKQFEANLSHDTLLSKSSLRSLSKVADHITKLNLSFTHLDDGLASRIGGFKHIEKLDIQRNKLTSKGLQFLQELKHLKSLNLYGNPIDDDAIEYLSDIPTLENLYIWQTEISAKAVDSLQQLRPNLTIHKGPDTDIFGDSNLKKPVYATTQDIFKDSLLVELTMNFKGVNIHYTIDGSEPDSTSLLYEEPIVIRKSAEVKSIARKGGWEDSPVASRTYVQAKYDVNKITLSQKPHEKYKAKGAKSLVDYERGTLQFVDGHWLGYENEHVSTTLNLGSRNTIESVSVGALESTGSYIFYPKGLKVSVSSDGRTFKKVGSLDIPTASSGHPPELNTFLLNFDEVEAQYVKVDIESNLVNPPWHQAPGAKCWIFLDEIIVN